ncbi:hypothetical protein EDD15DRAFT_1642599 [Pisolithus albus]|nr:hypothetical protein EDD15DRAFT_1642599 [Pisolithus albus]
MRLLNVQAVLNTEKDAIQGAEPETRIFEELDDNSVEYAILSHCWRKGEVNFDKMIRLMGMTEPHRNEVRQTAGYKKITNSCKKAMDDGHRWIWIDTCCIDKLSNPELSGAINSMFRWYGKSKTCYAYLDDVDNSTLPTEQDFEKYGKSNGWPKWFTRGWTLQELIAPKQIKFFDKNWEFIGEKRELAETLEKITRIPIEVLRDGLKPGRFCVAQIMSWAADRKTTRVEDRAYSLIGLFGVAMSEHYGEGIQKAFHRLQKQIIQKEQYSDHSIFAWNPEGQFGQLSGVLANDPNYFRSCHDVKKVEYDEFIKQIRLTGSQSSGKLACLGSRCRALPEQLSVILVTNVGIQIRLPVIPHRDSESVFRAVLACRDHIGNLITIDLKAFELSCYRIPASGRFQWPRLEFKTVYLACLLYSNEEFYHFKIDQRHASYHGFTRCGTFPHELTGDTVTISSLTNDPVIIVYANEAARSRFAVVLGYYLGRAFVHVTCDECSVDQEVPWIGFSKRLYDMLWVAPVEHCANSGVKCAHLPRSIWDARVVWHVTGNMQTSVVVDVEQCPGCCIGPRECTTTSNDRDTIDTPGFMQTVHNVRGLKLDGKDVWFCECSGERIALGDYGDYSSGSFRPGGNIFEDMRGLGINPADSAYHPVNSRVSSDADALQHDLDQRSVSVGFRLRDRYLTLHSPKGLSLPNNQELVLLLKALSIRLSRKHLVTVIIQCSNPSRANVEGNGRGTEGSASLTCSDFPEPGVSVPLCTIASPQVWRREPACARRREQFKNIREHFYTLMGLHRLSGTETGRESANRWMKREAPKFLSHTFGLESLKEYVGQITFFERLPLMVERPSYSETLTGDLPASRASRSRNPFKSRAAQNLSREIVVPPLLDKCKVLDELIELAKQKARCEAGSISQTLSVELLERLCTVISDVPQDGTHGSQSAAHPRQVDIRPMLQDVQALQTTLDGTADADEQRVLEEDVTGKILWLSWCEILSEVERRLQETVECVRRGGNSMTSEVRDRVRQGLDEIGEIVKKKRHAHVDDDLAHLRRIMLDARGGVSKHQLWVAARSAEQDKWASTYTSFERQPPCQPRTLGRTHHIDFSANSAPQMILPDD